MFGSYFLALCLTQRCLTQRCNIDCAYCYRGHPDTSDMPEEVIKKAIDYALTQAPFIQVQFTGGEPCLAVEGSQLLKFLLTNIPRCNILSL